MVSTLLGLLGPAPDRPGLDKDAEAWLRQVRLLILPEEEHLFTQLRDKEDRAEFRKIFWARRDPDPGTPRNEWQEIVAATQARADETFSYLGRKGSQSGCGQVLALLGEPDEVRSTEAPGESARDVRRTYDSLRELREGPRRPEVWVYRSRPGLTFLLPDGEARLEMDEACRFAEGARLMAELSRVAEARVSRPDLGYDVGPNGRLVRLEERLRGESPGRVLLRAPRSDFPIAIEPKLQLRSQSGGGYAAGLVRGDAAGLRVRNGPAGRSARLVVVAQATDAGGNPSLVSEREVLAEVGSDGSFLASFGVALKPGSYTLAVGCVEPESGRGSAVSVPFEMADFGGSELSASPLLVLPAAEPVAGPTSQDPFAAFALGSMRLQPRFGNAFSRADAVEILVVAYNGSLDPATEKASLRAGFSVLKDGRAVARGREQAFDTATAVASVGPIPLADFAPGAYVARVTLTDAVANRHLTREAAFEVRD